MALKFTKASSPIETKLGEGLERLANAIVDEANRPEVDIATRLAALKTAGTFWAMKNKVQPTDPEGSAFDVYGKSLEASSAGGGDSSTGESSAAELSFDDLELDGGADAVVRFPAKSK